MNSKRKQRLILVVFLVIGFSAVIGLAMFSLSENINLFYSPSQIKSGEAPIGARIRAGGIVVEGSVQRGDKSLATFFTLHDNNSELIVQYTGILPDLFREGQGIVALGRLNEQSILVADEVLAKHDENYMPPEVAYALKEGSSSNEYFKYRSSIETTSHENKGNK